MNNTLKKSIAILGTAIVAGGIITDNVVNPYSSQDSYYEIKTETTNGLEEVKFFKNEPKIRLSRWTDDAPMTITLPSGEANRSLLSDKIEYGTVSATPNQERGFDLEMVIDKPQILEFPIDAEQMDFFEVSGGLQAVQKEYEKIISDFNHKTGETYFISATLDGKNILLSYRRLSSSEGFLVINTQKGILKISFTINE